MILPKLILYQIRLLTPSSRVGGRALNRTISGVCQAIALIVVFAMIVPCLSQGSEKVAAGGLSSEEDKGAASNAGFVPASIGPTRELAGMPARQADAQTADYMPGELIVRFKPGAALDARDGRVASGIQSLDALNERFDIKSAEKLPSGSYVLKSGTAVDVPYAASLYEKDQNVVFAEPNALRQLYSVPNDPWFSQQWAHDLTQATAAWNKTTGSSNVVVALIDSGVDLDHPDLAANIWTNSGETPGNGRDDDHNGFVDDVHGWDFINNDNDPDDDMFHGTHCAGIIAGVGNNEIGVTGVTWHSKIMVLKAGTAYGSLPMSAIIDALYYAVDNGADIVSMSFGGSAPTDEEYDAIQYAHSKGLLLVAAAGNNANSNPTYPASFPEVIAVSATDAADNPAFFTSYGNWVDVSAPGLSLLSTFLNGTYAPCSGTSMACPYVAGLSALIWSEFPHLSRDGVRSQLQNTTDDLGTPGFDSYYGWGRVNAKWAVDHTSPSCDLRLWGLNAPHVMKPSANASIAGPELGQGNREFSRRQPLRERDPCGYRDHRLYY